MKIAPLLFALLISATWTTLTLASPELAVDQSTFNFGSIEQGKEVIHVYPIRNKGDAPLTIKGVRASCGCTAANSSAPVIQSGKNGEIKVTFNSTNFSGEIHKTVYVDTNDPKTPTYTLNLKGTVLEDIALTPKQINMGQITVDATKKMSLTIHNRGNKPLKLLSFQAPIPQISAKADKNLLKPGETGTILVSVTPRSTDRILSSYLTIMTDNSNKPQIRVPVFASLAR